jgi:hypothetical protein
MDRPKVEIEEPGKGFSRITVTFTEDARTTALNCAARLRRAASMAHGDPPQGVDPGVLDFEAGVLERLADRLQPPPARNEPKCDWSIKDALALANTLANHGLRDGNADAASSCIYSLCRILSAPCSAAAMREALEAVRDAFDSNDFGAMGDHPSSEVLDMADAVRRKVDAALAAPPRNCDVGTAEGQERRYFKLKTEFIDRMTKCPHVGYSYFPESLEWAQMPYEKGGAE